MCKVYLIVIVNILLIAISKQTFAQSCEWISTMPTSSFDQCRDGSYVLAFEDDFNGGSLDLTKWEIEVGVPRDPYFDLQKAYHTPNNIEVANGVLKIIAKREQRNNQWFEIWIEDDMENFWTNFEYSTGELKTKTRFGYGLFECSVKIPKGKGFFPAFWLFGSHIQYNEIDIFEFKNEYTNKKFDSDKLSKVHLMTSHNDYWKDGSSSFCPIKYKGDDFSQDFHTFSLLWEPDRMEWYVDGNLVRKENRYFLENGGDPGCRINAYGRYLINTIFPRNPMKIILNLAIQNGTNSGQNNADESPDASTVFPSMMEVDWVRFYDKIDINDVNITQSSQVPNVDDVYNTIIGNNVDITVVLL